MRAILWILTVITVITRASAQQLVLEVAGNGTVFLFESSIYFQEFQNCVCNPVVSKCIISKHSEGKFQDFVSTVGKKFASFSDSQSFRYLCGIKFNQVYDKYLLECERLFLDDQCIDSSHATCQSHFTGLNGRCDLGHVEIIWSANHSVKVSDKLMTTACKTRCTTETPSWTSKQAWPTKTLPPSKEVTAAFPESPPELSPNRFPGVAVTLEISTSETPMFTVSTKASLSTHTSSTATTLFTSWPRLMAAQTDPAREGKDSEDANSSVIGISVGVVVFAAVAVVVGVVGVVYWKCRRKATTWNVVRANHRDLNVTHANHSVALDDVEYGNTAQNQNPMSSTSWVNTYYAAVDSSPISRSEATVNARREEENGYDKETLSDLKGQLTALSASDMATQDTHKCAGDADATDCDYAGSKIAVFEGGDVYSTLRDHERTITDPYSVLPHSGLEVTPSALSPSSSIGQAPFSYSPAPPEVHSSTNHRQLVEIIDVDLPSGQHINHECPLNCSEYFITEAQEVDDDLQSIRCDFENNKDSSKDGGHVDEPIYFILENGQNSAKSETSEESFDNERDDNENPYDD